MSEGLGTRAMSEGFSRYAGDVRWIRGRRRGGVQVRGRTGIRSSAAGGSPRPSWLLVVPHREPSGGRMAVRNRPYVPTSSGGGGPASPVLLSGTCQGRRAFGSRAG